MSLATGTRLGPYVIEAALGAGGMGEVYRARDTKLNRDVAIKILPAIFASDPERLARFEREGQALAALNDPNIATVYGVIDLPPEAGRLEREADSGKAEAGSGIAIVMELLEGETLRQRLDHGPLPARKAIELATQIADGLAAAHDKGIIHRDLKPENVFVTPAGRVKILDFGLARQHAFAAAGDAPTVLQGSDAGMVVGTIGYMSPEQVRGGAVDHRSDVFAFGCVLFEMLTGRRAFQRSTPADSSAAILNEDPVRDAAAPPIPSAVDPIVQHCLEKQPGERFQSMRDVAFALRTSSSLSGTGTVAATAPASSRRWMRAIVGGAAMIAAAVGGYAVHDRLNPAPSLSFRKLTFQRGTVYSARFAPEGHTIVYGAAWGGKGVQLYSTRVEGGDSRPFGIAADVLGISAQGEMVVSMERRAQTGFLSVGRLGRTPLAGGEPRVMLEGVVDADWSRDGSTVAVTREIGAEAQLEYPIGHQRFKSAGYLSSPRIAPDTRGIAFIEHPVKGDDRGTVDYVDLSGMVTTLTPDLPSITGLAWSPDGREIWYSAWLPGEGYAINAVTPGGRGRLVSRIGVRARLLDQLGGRLLLGYETFRAEISGLLAGDDRERDYSWLDGGAVTGLSPSGDLMLFNEGSEGGGPTYSSFLRRAGSVFPVRLGEGWGADLSADGRWIVGARVDPPARMTIVPTGAGDSRMVPVPGIESIGGAQWLPDGAHVLLWANEPAQAFRGWVIGTNGEGRRPITPPDVMAPAFTNSNKALAPDGRSVLVANLDGKWSLYPVDGGPPQPVAHLKADDQVVQWADTPRTVYVRKRGSLPLRIARVNLDTGQREPWHDLMPGDPAGVADVNSVIIASDGRHYAYSSFRLLTELYLLEGVR